MRITTGIPGRDAGDEAAARSVAASKGEHSCSPAASLQGRCPGRWVVTRYWGIAALQARAVCHHGGSLFLGSPGGKEAG